MAWYLKGKPKKWAHHYGIALRSSYVDQTRWLPAPAAPISRSRGGRRSVASSIAAPSTGHRLTGKQWDGSPASCTALRGERQPTGESQDYIHKAIGQKVSAVNSEKPLKSKSEDGHVSWRLSSAGSTRLVLPVTYTSPIAGTVLP